MSICKLSTNKVDEIMRQLKQIVEDQRGLEEWYIEEVKLYLTCNNDIYCGFYTFDYSDEQVNNNYDYFIDCFKRGLSPYKALLFFYDYLQEKQNNNCRLK